MQIDRKLSRRSFFTAVTGGLVAGGGLAFGPSGRALAQTPAGAPDGADQEAFDSDKGTATDNSNIGGARGGRLRARVNLCSDTDAGPGSDPLGESRVKHSFADVDRGPQADPARLCPRPWYRAPN